MCKGVKVTNFTFDRLLEYQYIEKNIKYNKENCVYINNIIISKLLEIGIQFKFIPKPENLLIIS